ncbi:heavy-metal-associated domain-containing protein [Rhodocytophaga aerolata]|uniref:Heavy-metal-associated domain-containing protein n=1 Tax=Rhodocytophaga aerolata TaxID=455078 RepID=A0ABT8RAV0_9BACT|nr:heavy-metal-associated domain-containing protein [Rhodocytophaga aerolata]MDO1449237.1 heavy-metal-associated domain-containing protein [Rhodocytophaga aerolata]
MEILKFKTNIKCGGCIATVTPFLDKEESIQNWQVDTSSADKVLTVSGHDVNPQKVKNVVEKAGFKAEVIQVAGIGGKDL